MGSATAASQQSVRRGQRGGEGLASTRAISPPQISRTESGVHLDQYGWVSVTGNGFRNLPRFGPFFTLQVNLRQAKAGLGHNLRVRSVITDLNCLLVVFDRSVGPPQVRVGVAETV